MKTPHQCLSHTCHGHHTEADLLQLVQHQARWVIHVILGTETSINKAILLSTDVGISASLSKLLLEKKSAVNCSSACSLPSTTLFHLNQIANGNTSLICIPSPWMVYSKSAKQQLSSPLPNHTEAFSSIRPDFSSAVNMYMLTAKMYKASVLSA